MNPDFIYQADIPENHPCFSGHFPQMPILPAVSQFTLLTQAISVYTQQTCAISDIPTCKFLHPIQPNMHVSIQLFWQDECKMKFIIRTDTDTIAKGQLNYKVIASCI